MTTYSGSNTNEVVAEAIANHDFKRESGLSAQGHEIHNSIESGPGRVDIGTTNAHVRTTFNGDTHQGTQRRHGLD